MVRIISARDLGASHFDLGCDCTADGVVYESDLSISAKPPKRRLLEAEFDIPVTTAQPFLGGQPLVTKENLW